MRVVAVKCLRESVFEHVERALSLFEDVSAYALVLGAGEYLATDGGDQCAVDADQCVGCNPGFNVVGRFSGFGCDQLGERVYAALEDLAFACTRLTVVTVASRDGA